MLHILETLRALTPKLAAAIGDDVEVVLHDLRRPQASLVAIAGDVTGRKVGAPATDLVLRVMRQRPDDEDLINYFTQTPEGKPLRSSTMFIRDEEGTIVGCLCINWDLTKWLVARHVIDGHCRTHPFDESVAETFASDVEEMLSSTVEEAVEQEGVPVVLMKKADKLRTVRALDEQGIFLIKGAVEFVADALEVSRYTIYKYLDEVREEDS